MGWPRRSAFGPPWRTGEEGGELFWDGAEAATAGFFDGVPEGEVHAVSDGVGDVEAVSLHLFEGPSPGVELFEAAGLVDVEADGVVADFVEEDGRGHRAAGTRGFDEA